jgi:hypothetical protein
MCGIWDATWWSDTYVCPIVDLLRSGLEALLAWPSGLIGHTSIIILGSGHRVPCGVELERYLVSDVYIGDFCGIERVFSPGADFNIVDSMLVSCCCREQ